MNRVVVLGGTGMAGHVIAMYLAEQGYDIYITSKSAKNDIKSKSIDATDFDSLDAWLNDVNPDIIINCIGVLPKQADSYPDEAILLNAYLPQRLSRAFRDTRVKIIHLSTDCVFSGKRGKYSEKDIPDGITLYDRSKALGEIVNNKDLTFRMSIIGPDKHEQGIGLFNWFMGQTGEISGYTHAIWNGVTTIHLAQAIDAAIKQNLTGLYQLAPKEAINKYNLLLLFQQVFHKDDVHIIPYDSFRVDKSLANTRSDFLFEIKPYPTQIEEMRDWIYDHKSIYGKKYFMDTWTCISKQEIV